MADSPVASVLTDIATHLPSDFLSGAIFLGSLPCTGQTVQDVAHPEAISGVTELLLADTPDRMLKSREAFLDSCLADPSLITFETRCTWLGIMGFSLPIGAGGTLGREQDLNRLFDLTSISPGNRFEEFVETALIPSQIEAELPDHVLFLGVQRPCRRIIEDFLHNIRM